MNARVRLLTLLKISTLSNVHESSTIVPHLRRETGTSTLCANGK